MAKSGRFWRNVVVIAVAHVALIAGLIRWSLAARASNPESIVWLGAAQDLAAEESGNEEERSGERNAHVAQQKPPKDDEAKEEKPAVTTRVKSNYPHRSRRQRQRPFQSRRQLLSRNQR